MIRRAIRRVRASNRTDRWDIIQRAVTLGAMEMYDALNADFAYESAVELGRERAAQFIEDVLDE